MKRYERQTRAWVRRVVIGLNLCPFASGPERAGRIRYVVEECGAPDDLLTTLLTEMRHLVEHPLSEVETTLIIHPNVLEAFDDYLDFVAEAERLLAEAGLEGILQIATFHPDYQFAGTPVKDPANFTNRSPYPTLHLLREESIERALAGYPDPEGIPERNIEKMRELGPEHIQKLLAGILSNQ